MKFHRALRHWALIVCGMLITITCDPPTTAPTTGDISGTVLDASSSQPISGATITTDPITSSKTTDSEGAYTIEGVEPGNYAVQASKDGYQTGTSSIKVIAGEIASADIQLSPVLPSLHVSTTSLDFSTTTTSLPVTISNTGKGQLDWTVSENANWISVNPTSGSITTEQAAITVSMDRSGLDAGDYSESLVISSNGGSASITVSMTVQGPVLIVSINSLNFGTSSNSLIFNITNAGVGTLTYNAVYSANWVTITPTSGSATTETDVITVTVDRTEMAYGNHYETVTITTNANSGTVETFL